MGIYDDLSNLDDRSPTPGVAKTSKKKRAIKKTSKSTDQPTEQSTNRPVNRLTDQSIDVETLGSIVERPRAFYITLKVDRWLDEGVRHLRKKGLHKMDRSVLLNALLHDENLFKPKALDQMRKRFLAHLTNRSLKRVQSTD